MFKVDIRKNCKVCTQAITSKRFRSYCSVACRTIRNNLINRRPARYHAARNHARYNQYAAGKLQCLFCAGWYWKVGAHVTQRHGLTARQYREVSHLEVKRGITPEHLRQKWGDTALANGTYKNLEAGAKYRFRRGQKGVGIYPRAPATLQKLRNNQKLSHKHHKP